LKRVFPKLYPVKPSRQLHSGTKPKPTNVNTCCFTLQMTMIK
jgi:hypothetical protein